LFQKPGRVAIRMGKLPEIANGSRMRVRSRGERGNIDRNSVALQRAGNRDNDSGNPAEQKYRLFQKVPAIQKVLITHKEEFTPARCYLTAGPS
jgi:hypothetical protein